MKQWFKLLKASDEKRGFHVSRIRNTPLKEKLFKLLKASDEKRGFGV
jgi:hypothetical protein